MKKLLLMLFLSIGISTYAQEESRFESYSEGIAFTTITVDGVNKKVWAGTDQNGVFSLNTDVETLPQNFSVFGFPGSSPSLFDIKTKNMAADFSGNIWIAHQGINFNGGQGGLERISSNGNVKHYSPDRNALGFQFFGRDGIGGLRLNSVAVDKNNRVWTVNRNHNLTSGSTFILTPGDISFKDANQTTFTTKGAWFDRNSNIAVKPAELPYPANTYNPGPTDNPESRNMQAISADDKSVWVGSWGYERKDNGERLPKRVLKYKLDGTFEKAHTFDDMKFPPGGVINAICANGSKGTWVTTSSNQGFAVYKNEEWTYLARLSTDSSNGVGFAQVLPEDTRFNDNAIWKDKLGRVYLGTDKGLIIYNGYGDVTDSTSYKLYTNYDYGATSGNEQNVFDTTMLSNNITGGSSDPNNPYRSWVATNNGIMKLFIPIEGMKLYHVKEHFSYTSVTKDDEKNINLLTALKNEVIDGLILDSEVPSISADKSDSTVFRFETPDPAGYYTPNEKYRLYVGPGPISMIDDEDYIKKYGQFTPKLLSSYPNNPLNTSELDYVEFIYTHPEYIPEVNYVNNKNYAKYEFNIVDISDPSNTIELYKHPVKIAVPPILLGHGVWSSVKSVTKMENSLKAKGFENYALLKAWRHDDQIAENPFMVDSYIIPQYINKLKEQAAGNLFSTGKVNVVVHSRGGLYTKAYIEGIDNKYLYKDDINSLITVNTPHFGSQGANFSMDKRKFITANAIIDTFTPNIGAIFPDITIEELEFTLGDIGSIKAPKADRIKKEGSKHLIVEIDNVSGVLPNEHPHFVENLNSPNNLSTLRENKVPLHVISSEFNLCGISPILCNDLGGSSPISSTIIKTAKRVVALGIIKFMLCEAPMIFDEFVEDLYNGEISDYVVPLSSMQAGLGGTQYNSHFNGIPHSSSTVYTQIGINETPEVFERIQELFRSNVYDVGDGSFTQNGIIPEKLTYNLFPNFEGLDFNFNNQNINSKVLINRDPIVFDNVSEGNILNFNVFVEEVDKLMIVYENEGDDTVSFIVKDNLNLKNEFSYTIPEGFPGKGKITAYAFKNGIVGYAKSEVNYNINIPSGLTLQNIKFSQRDPILLNQDNYSYELIGTFSDGIDRIINDLDGLTFSIEDTTVANQINNSTLKAEVTGSTILSASINGLEDSILVTVEENPALFQTILTNFYGELSPDNSNVTVFWNTLREYENQTFVLQTSYGTPDSFIDIHEEAGNGTNPEPSQFNYVDSSFGTNEIIFYRLKMIDTSGNETYSSIIQINRITLSTNNYDNESFKLKLFPNPNSTNNAKLTFNANHTDKNSKLEIYSLQGKKLYANNISVINGKNELDIKLPSNLSSGIYLVKVSTLEFVKSIKLVIE